MKTKDDLWQPVILCMHPSGCIPLQHLTSFVVSSLQAEDSLPYPDEIDRQMAEVEAAVAVEEAAVKAEEASISPISQRLQADDHTDRGMLPSSVPASPADPGAPLATCWSSPC